MTKTSYPVVRRGRLIRASIPTDQGLRPTVLTFEQGEAALRLVDQRRGEFLGALKAAIAASAKKDGKTLSWCEPDEFPGLSPAGRNRGLGAIYDLEEIAFRLNGDTVLARACLTLCTMTDADRVARDDKLPLSKFWIRFMLVKTATKTGEARRATGLPVKAAIQFGMRYRILGDIALRSLAPLYRAVIADVLKTEVRIDAEANGSFSVLALGAPEADFADLFDATRAGSRLADELQREDADAAKQLVRLAFETIVDGKTPKLDGKIDLKAALGERVRYIVYEGPTASRGLFLGRFDDDEVQFVGLTQSPQDDEAAQALETLPLNRLHSYSANAVSGGLVQEYALAF